MKKTNLVMSLAAVAGASLLTAAPVFAAGGDIDFSSMTGAIAATAVVAAIVSMGVVKIGPNFTRWAVNKVASFF